MDVLTDALEAIHITSVVSGRLELSAPWGMRKAPKSPGFFVVIRGSAWFEMDGMDAPLQIGGGDLVLLPHGLAHSLRDSLSTPLVPAEQIFSGCPQRKDCQPGGVFAYGGGGALTTVVGGKIQFEDGANNPLLRALPPMIHVRGDNGTPMPWLETCLRFIATEMASGQPGASTIVSRLADILFVQAIRAHVLTRGDEAKGWLRALSDPQIGRALSMIHEHPGAPWSVESLAAEVAMSRSAFSARFSELVEEPPLTYLTRWRMQRASKLLRSSDETIAGVAAKVGYDAEAAFSKAFKRWLGTAPGAYRRGAAATAATAIAS
jgi:AraC-like DNA-binding protein